MTFITGKNKNKTHHYVPILQLDTIKRENSEKRQKGKYSLFSELTLTLFYPQIA